MVVPVFPLATPSVLQGYKGFTPTQWNNTHRVNREGVLQALLGLKEDWLVLEPQCALRH